MTADDPTWTLMAINAKNMLDEALESEDGIEVRVYNNPDNPVQTPVLRAKQILYRFKSLDASFKNFAIRLAPRDPDKFLWITKESQKRDKNPKDPENQAQDTTQVPSPPKNDELSDDGQE